MAIQPIDQRLAGMLPEQVASPLVEPLDLQPMPAENVAEEPAADMVSEGTPSMEEGVQVAGPAQSAINKLIRREVTSGASKAERNIIPGKIPEGELGEPAKVGPYTVIPEADQTLTEQTTEAISRRQKQGALVGKPGGSPEEAFNLSRYQTHDAAGVVAGVADSLGIKTKRVTFDEIKAKAASSGIDESFLTRLVDNNGQMMGNATDTYKALEVLESSANELDRLFKLINEGNATDAQKLQLRQQIALHGMIQKGVKGMQSETARALAVFRIPREGNVDVIRQVLDQYGGDRSLQDMARSYLNLDSRSAKNQLVEKSMYSGIKDVWFTTFINGLLSGPTTHAKNIIGNTLFGLFQIPERLIAAFYSNTLPAGVRSWKALVPGSAEDKIAYDEALTMVTSLRQGWGDGLHLASKAWKNKMPSDALSKIEMQRGLQESTGETLQRITGAGQETWMGKALDFYGTAINVPGRALMTQDEFFKGVLYRMELNTQVSRRAKTLYRQAIDDGMTEVDAAAKVSVDIKALLADPPADLDQVAREFAQRGTFTGELPEGLANLQKTFNHPMLKILVPFFKTPANIGLEVLERTPFAPLSSRFRNDLMKGGVHRDMALAKVTLSTSLMATFASYAAEGMISGSGPSRLAERQALERTGWRPYSIKVGDQWLSYAGMEPVSALLAISADYAEYGMRAEDDDEIAQVFLGAAMGLTEFMKEQPYLQGVADIAGFLQASEGEKSATLFNNIAKQYGSFVIGGSPAGVYSSMVGTISRYYDPTIKDVKASPDLPLGVRGFMEAFSRYRSRLPAFNDYLPDSLTLWGEKRVSGQGKVYEMVLPTRVSPEQFSETDDELVRLGSPIGMPSRKMQGVELDAYQYNRLLTIYGQELNAKEEILKAIRSPGFEIMNLDDQQKRVQARHSQLMDSAKSQLLSEDITLRDKISEVEEGRKANGLFYKPN